MVGGDSVWAREIRRQLISEIELVSVGLATGGELLHQDTPAEASDRIVDLRRRLDQVERLIEAIEALHIEEDIAGERAGDRDNPFMPDHAAMGRVGRNDRDNSLAD